MSGVRPINIPQLSIFKTAQRICSIRQFSAIVSERISGNACLQAQYQTELIYEQVGDSHNDALCTRLANCACTRNGCQNEVQQGQGSDQGGSIEDARRLYTSPGRTARSQVTKIEGPKEQVLSLVDIYSTARIFCINSGSSGSSPDAGRRCTSSFHRGHASNALANSGSDSSTRPAAARVAACQKIIS